MIRKINIQAIPSWAERKINSFFVAIVAAN
jgi:hypothetical protein